MGEGRTRCGRTVPRRPGHRSGSRQCGQVLKSGTSIGGGFGFDAELIAAQEAPADPGLARNLVTLYHLSRQQVCAMPAMTGDELRSLAAQLAVDGARRQWKGGPDGPAWRAPAPGTSRMVGGRWQLRCPKCRAVYDVDAAWLTIAEIEANKAGEDVYLTR